MADELSETEHPLLAGVKAVSSLSGVYDAFRAETLAPVPRQVRDHLLNDTLVAIHGQEHFDRRKIESALFSKAAVTHYVTNVLDPAIDRFMNFAASEMRCSDRVVRADLMDLVHLMLINIAAEVIGLDNIRSVDAIKHLSELWEILSVGTHADFVSPNDASGLREKSEQAKTVFVDQYMATSRARREILVKRFQRGELDESLLPIDLITVMLRSVPLENDPDLLVREAILYLVASVASPTQAIAHVVDELNAWMDTHPEESQSLVDPKFLRLCSMEAIRLFLATPALFRRSNCPMQIDDGGNIVELGEFETVAIVRMMANRDKSVFGDDAGRFNPFRSVDQIPQYGVAFGAGEHVCIGRPLVMGIPGQGIGEVPGIVVRILMSLYRHGVRPDPASLPTYREPLIHKRFNSYSVIFDRL